MEEQQRSTSVYVSTLKLGLVCLLSVCFSTSLLAQVQVEFSGNRKCKDDHLLQILRIDTSDTHDDIVSKVQRIRNLPAVVNAEVDSIGKNYIRIKVEEGITTIPLVAFGGIEDNQWFLAGLKELSLFGRSIEGTAFYRNNQGEHNGYFSLRVPYVKGTRWGYSFEAQRYASLEPLQFGELSSTYRYLNYTVGGTIIKEFKYRHFLEAGASFLYEDYEQRDDIFIQGAPASAKIRKVLYKLTHSIDRVNRHAINFGGWSINQHFQVIDDIDSGYDAFLIYWADILYFRRLQAMGGNLAARVRLGVSSNNETPFAPFVLDSQVTIRGVGNRVDRGTAVAVLNLEYRQQFFAKGNFAGQIVGFSDLGNWRTPGGDFDQLTMNENLVHFVGLGTRLIWTRSNQAVLRIDYGVNTMDDQQRGIVLGLGHYF